MAERAKPDPKPNPNPHPVPPPPPAPPLDVIDDLTGLPVWELNYKPEGLA